MSSIVMDPNSYEDRYEVSLQVYYSRALAYNASQIHYYESHLEKVLKLPQSTREDIKHARNMLAVLENEREDLSEKYLKALRENK